MDYINQRNDSYKMNIDDFSIGQTVLDTDNNICFITNKTTNSIEVFISKKTSKGIDCKQWFDMSSFNKRFKNMTYTQEQKELLLDRLFDGVVCMDIYGDIEITHKNEHLTYYNPKTNMFWLNWYQIWSFFLDKNDNNRQEINDLTSGILRELTKRKELTTTWQVFCSGLT